MTNLQKIKLIKKYGVIRFKRFWREWGVNKEEFVMIVSTISLILGLFSFYIIGCMF